MGKLLVHTLGVSGLGLLGVTALMPTQSSSYQSLSGIDAGSLIDGGGGGQFDGGEVQPLKLAALGSAEAKVDNSAPAKSSGQQGRRSSSNSTGSSEGPEPTPSMGVNAVPPNAAFKDEAAFWLKGGNKGDGGQSQALKPPALETLPVSKELFRRLYQGPTSLGVVAVGVAEGTYRLMVRNGSLYVQPTRSYYGHVDPGNLSWGARVVNYGPCSDQGRSGGNLATAAEQCVQRLAGRLPTVLSDFSQAGIDPREDLEGLLNGVDLYNQASPIHSRWFPKALAIARQGGLGGLEAYAWARTASFYLDDKQRLDLRDGTNRATGLIGICRREGSAQTQWECVYRDQARRVGAIATVYRKFLQLSEES
ncbi:MAG: hypothetical protein ACFCBU_11945 [Cyanophyceae cyanobacterium]